LLIDEEIFEMVVCPSCKSTRIRDDYKPAPVYFRAIGFRALLCDHCNRQFRAFSPVFSKRPVKVHYRQKANVFNPARPVDLNRLKERSTVDRQKAVQTKALTSLMQLADREPPVSGELLEPIPRNLRTQITKLNQERAKYRADQAQVVEEQRKKRLPLCPHCGSQSVRQRHRKVWERAVLSFTDLKAFFCRSCNVAFYARMEDRRPDPRVIDVQGMAPQ
jgi:transposase-like protein